MKIELRNIKHLAALSEETHCYSATLYADGRKVAEVGNDGHGGCDRVYPLDRVLLAAVEAYVAALPPVRFHGRDLPQSLEGICCDLVNEHLALRDLRRKLKAKVLAQYADGRVYEWKLPKGRMIADLIVHVAAAKPDAKILNTMSEADALAIYRAI